MNARTKGIRAMKTTAFSELKEKIEKQLEEERREALEKLEGYSLDPETERLFVRAARRRSRMLQSSVGLVLAGLALAIGLKNDAGKGAATVGILGGILVGMLSAIPWRAVRCSRCGRELRAVRLFTHPGNDLLWYVCDDCRTCAFSGERSGSPQPE